MIKVGGLLPFTMIDFPGKLSAVIFCQGCLLNCPYCHNPELQSPATKTQVTWEEVVDLLKSRQNLLDGVVLSGGEPLIQKELPQAIREIKSLGYQVALHTSGALPEALAAVLPDISWIGLDVKGAFSKYHEASGTKPEFKIGEAVQKSLDMILKSGVPFEARTTTDPRVVTKEDIWEMASYLSQKGVRTYALQEYRPCENGRMPEPPAAAITAFYQDAAFLKKLESLFESFIVRRA